MNIVRSYWQLPAFLFLIFFFGNGISFAQTAPKRSKAAPPNEQLIEQPKSTTTDIVSENKGVTIAGDPHPMSPAKEKSLETKKQTDNHLFIHKPVNDGTEAYLAAKAAWATNYPAEYEAWVKFNSESNPKIAEDQKMVPANRSGQTSNKVNKLNAAKQ